LQFAVVGVRCEKRGVRCMEMEMAPREPS